MDSEDSNFQITETLKLSQSQIDCNSNPNVTSKKRDNYLSWDQYFMTVACVSAMRSKDPHTQVCFLFDI